MKIRVRWVVDGAWDPKPVRVKHRWFPWPKTSLVLGRWIWTKGTISGQHLREELIHVLQYARWGKLGFWVRYFGGQMAAIEAEAHAANDTDYPHWEKI